MHMRPEFVINDSNVYFMKYRVLKLSDQSSVISTLKRDGADYDFRG